jgi:hypothetical protein
LKTQHPPWECRRFNYLVALKELHSNDRRGSSQIPSIPLYNTAPSLENGKGRFVRDKGGSYAGKQVK